jgi:glycosyltransferase involved in cell wall biosynthesis
MNLSVAYLVNQYPKVSHSFIRREIFGVEAHGVQIQRFSIRSCADELVDQADISEVEKTRVVLERGLLGLLPSLFCTIIQRPSAFLNTLHLAYQLGKNSEKGVWYHLVYLAEACVLLSWCKESGVKHIHVHFGTNSTTVAMLCQALGGPPYSFTVHGPEEFDNVHLIALPEKIKRAKFVIAISSFGKSQLYRWTSFEDWSKIHVVRCGVDQSFLNKMLTPIPDEPRFVCIGRLAEQKGHVLLLQAAHQLLKEGRSFKLIFVGDGELRPQIEHLIELFDLQSHVEITGWSSGAEVRAHLIQSRALVLPSFAEGLPVVIMEALALGRPVISTCVAGIPELVEPGVNGWLVPPGSVDALADAMRLALNSSVQELTEMGKIGVERVTKFHNSDIEAHILANLL